MDLNTLYINAEIAHHAEEYQSALNGYLSVLAHDNNHYNAHRWIADVYLELEDYDNAIKHFEHALIIDDSDADVFNDAGLAYYEQDIPDKSVYKYVQGIALNPDHACLHSNLGKALYEMFYHTDKKEAQKIAKNWLENFPDNADASFMGAAILGLNPAQQNADFVRGTFDDFADTFDEKLAELEYQAPQLLQSALLRHINTLGIVLDAGCGTGLVAPLVHKYCATITGVDLSQSMLDLAKERNLYNALHTGDLLDYLSSNTNIYNTIIASDVLCYFGELNTVFSRFFTTLKTEGIIALSLEECTMLETQNTGYILNASGRYKHAQDYVTECLIKNGFSILEINTKTLRQEHGKPVHGLVLLAQK